MATAAIPTPPARPAPEPHGTPVEPAPEPDASGEDRDRLSAAVRTLDIGPLSLERGGRLPGVRLAVETWGTLAPSGDNAILIEHALTGDSHVSSHPELPAGTDRPGWWEGIIGPGAPIDTDRWYVVCANVLGGCKGSTGPASIAPDGRAWGSRFPFITVRDMVRAEVALMGVLGVRHWAAVIGGSMGGMRTVEWAVGYPDALSRAIILASTAYASAEQIAWCQPQLLAIRQDPNFHGGDYYEAPTGPEAGLGLARRIAHITYRTEPELSTRFGRSAQSGEDPLRRAGRYAVESYLDHQANKLTSRFDANSYLVLTEAMNSHDVGRWRGGLTSALTRVRAECTVVEVDSDRLYPPRLTEEMVRGLGERGRHARVSSLYGHDGFLIEIEQVGAIVAEALA